MISDTLEYDQVLASFRALNPQQQANVRQRVTRLRANIYRGHLLVAYASAIQLEFTGTAPAPEACTKEGTGPAEFVRDQELPNVCALGEPRSFYRPTPK